MVREPVTQRMQTHLGKLGWENDMLNETIRVTARALSPEEAIGNPEHDDYPLVAGRERMMEAEVRGERGHAFTDMYGCWEGTLREVCENEPANNFRRAILVATLNAVMRFAGEVAGTVHCKDTGPVECARAIPSLVESEGLKPPFVLVGYQPRFAESLSSLGQLRIVDMDAGNIGQMKAGVKVIPPERTDEALAGAGCAFITGSTVVNGTVERFLNLPVPVIFYGVTIAGPAALLGLRRFCPAGT